MTALSCGDPISRSPAQKQGIQRERTASAEHERRETREIEHVRLVAGLPEMGAGLGHGLELYGAESVWKVDREDRHEEHDRHGDAEERHEGAEQHRAAADELGDDGCPSEQWRGRNMQCVQNAGERTRAARELREAVLHEAIADDEAQGKCPPALTQKTDRPGAKLEETLHAVRIRCNDDDRYNEAALFLRTNLGGNRRACGDPPDRWFVVRGAGASTVEPKTEAEERLRALMIRGLEGDSSAHKELLALLSRHLRGYFARRLGAAAHEVEDLVQETLLAVHLKRDSYDRALPFMPWAYAVARYKLIDHLRRRYRQTHVPLEDAGALFAADDPEEGVLRTDLDRLLEQLPSRQRSLLQDVKLQGLSIEEAAQKRGVTAVSARVMLHRTLKWLNRAWHDENG